MRSIWNIFFGVFDYKLADHKDFSVMIEEFFFYMPLGGRVFIYLFNFFKNFLLEGWGVCFVVRHFE